MTDPNQSQPAADRLLAANLRVLTQRHPAAARALDGPDWPPRAQVTETTDRSGRNVVRLGWAEDRPVSLHSAVDPAGEGERLAASANLAGAGLVAVIGLGLGHHLDALARRLPAEIGLVVVEASTALFRLALARRDLTDLLARPGLELIVGSQAAEAAVLIGRRQLKAGFPRLGLMIHPASVRALAPVYGPIKDRLKSAAAVRLEDKLRYDKFTGPNLTVLLVHSGYFLIEEIRQTLPRLGHRLVEVALPDRKIGAEAVIKDLIRAIVDHRPDFLLTTNHLGFDRAGVLTGFLEAIRLPTASWYVDSPLHTVRHYQANVSPWVSLFLWDRDYLATMTGLGFEHADYLPLAAFDDCFRPGRGGDGDGPPLAMAANSMTQTIGEKIAELGLTPAQVKRFEGAGLDFASTAELNSLAALKRAGLWDDLGLETAPARRRLQAEALVINLATRDYRRRCLAALSGLGLTVAGDGGWNDQLAGLDYRLIGRLDYYAELPGFYRRATVCFNATSLQMKTGLNQRVFDVPACGGFLLTDWRDQLADLFDPDVEVAAYESPEEARELAAYYLNHPVERQKIAVAAHKRVMAEHTYRHRLARMIDLLTRQHTRTTWLTGQS